MQHQVADRLESAILPDIEGLEHLSLPTGRGDVAPGTDDGTDDVRVGIDRAAAVAVVQLNRPAKRNALTQGMMDRLVTLLGRLDRSEAVRAVVLMGTRRGAFSGMLTKMTVQTEPGCANKEIT